jgi:hypothetical protein
MSTPVVGVVGDRQRRLLNPHVGASRGTPLSVTMSARRHSYLVVGGRRATSPRAASARSVGRPTRDGQAHPDGGTPVVRAHPTTEGQAEMYPTCIGLVSARQATAAVSPARLPSSLAIGNAPSRGQLGPAPRPAHQCQLAPTPAGPIPSAPMPPLSGGMLLPDLGRRCDQRVSVWCRRDGRHTTAITAAR